LSKAGYKESTIRSAVSALKAIAKRIDLLNTEAVKTYLTKADMGEGRKEIVVVHLAKFYRYLNVPFERPRYQRIDKLPFIPIESEVDALIAGLGKKTATFVQLIKETGSRPGEAWALKWIDIDPQSMTVTITPEKGSRARRLKISNLLLAMLNVLPKEWATIFHRPDVNAIDSFEWFRRTFLNQRREIARKLQNPRIDRISFKTLRHWKATMLYARTKDILLVMQVLGHKNIKNTLVYTHLVDFQNDDYSCRTTRTVDEAEGLVEAGFEYVTSMEGVQLFRKRK
jgi:integrase